MKDINDPKIKEEIEALERAFYQAVEVLREDKNFKIYIERVEALMQATQDAAMKAKSWEDFQRLQMYFMFTKDLLSIAYAEDPNNQPNS